ncbi:hypothetical protein COCVIDRAFT_38901 [Bipolaris victoriae FI3]|uniref:Uncharacterized protein n=1 Tax=Bipolaris victoriae (strain FI3) TaxID=930091 RepID=W7EJ36_BIPV3|nr:hypothetical protein COCVIDRAFT_38901 [Bipolaris victoriae FI3]
MTDCDKSYGMRRAGAIARAHTHTATATVTVTAPATANTQDDNGCKKRRIAGRTRGKRLLVLMNPLNAPGVVETQCSRPSINGQTGEPWWATCQASSSSANLYQCPYIHAGLQVAFPVTTPAKALPAVPQPTSVLLPLLRYLYTPAGLCRSCVSDEPPHPFASASFHRLILLIVPLPCSSSSTLAALLRIVTVCFSWVLCNPTVEPSCMHADDTHAEKPPCPWRPFLLDRQVDPRQSARPQLAMQRPTRLKCPWSRACLYYLPSLPAHHQPSSPHLAAIDSHETIVVSSSALSKQDWHRLLLPQ